jgi:hypothetical protein
MVNSPELRSSVLLLPAILTFAVMSGSAYVQ